MPDDRKPSIRNIAETPWEEFPDHHGGALSKPLFALSTGLGLVVAARLMDRKKSCAVDCRFVRAAQKTNIVHNRKYHAQQNETRAQFLRMQFFPTIYEPAGCQRSVEGMKQVVVRRVTR